MLKLSKLMKFLLAFALPMYITESGGGGAQVSESMNTDSFASLLGGDGAEDQTSHEESEAVTNDEETGEESANEETEGGEQEATEGDDDAQAEQTDKDSAESFLELDINGEKVKVSKDEAKNGYLRQHDYTQKTQALARERQESQAHIAQQVQTVQQMSQEIGQLTNLDAQLAQYAQVDWQQLRADDPTSYSIHLAEYNDMRAKRGEVVQAIGFKQQQLSQAQQQQFAAKTAEAQAHLSKAIPGFGKEHISAMTEAGLKHGFSKQELAQVADGRMMEVLWKASQYDKQQSATSKAVKAVAALPTRAAKPAGTNKPAAQLNLEKQAHRLSQTGSKNDFIALLNLSSKG